MTSHFQLMPVAQGRQEMGREDQVERNRLAHGPNCVKLASGSASL